VYDLVLVAWVSRSIPASLTYTLERDQVHCYDHLFLSPSLNQALFEYMDLLYTLAESHARIYPRTLHAPC
jgi:hypothetical protein